MDENKDVRQAEPQNAPQDKQPAPLSEARKTALLRYMAVLFAVAFLLVLLSLILQAHSSKATISELTQTSSSALSNVEQLQAQNRDLQDEKQTLTQEKSELEAQVEDLQKQLDETKQADENEESAEKLKLELELAHTKEAYEALLVAKNCEMHEGNVTFSKAMDTLADLEQYLGTEARAEYEKLLAE